MEEPIIKESQSTSKYPNLEPLPPKTGSPSNERSLLFFDFSIFKEIRYIHIDGLLCSFVLKSSSKERIDFTVARKLDVCEIGLSDKKCAKIAPTRKFSELRYDRKHLLHFMSCLKA